MNHMRSELLRHIRWTRHIIRAARDEGDKRTELYMKGILEGLRTGARLSSEARGFNSHPLRQPIERRNHL